MLHSHSTQLEERTDESDTTLGELLREDGDNGVVGERLVVAPGNPGDVGEGVAVGDADEDDGGIDVGLCVVGSYGDGWASWRDSKGG